MLCIVCGGLCVARLRLSLGKRRMVAATFAVPGALRLTPVTWLALGHELLALTPLATVAVLCFCAAALFAPTAGTRFAAFERHL